MIFHIFIQQNHLFRDKWALERKDCENSDIKFLKRADSSCFILTETDYNLTITNKHSVFYGFSSYT